MHQLTVSLVCDQLNDHWNVTWHNLWQQIRCNQGDWMIGYSRESTIGHVVLCHSRAQALVLVQRYATSKALHFSAPYTFQIFPSDVHDWPHRLNEPAAWRLWIISRRKMLELTVNTEDYAIIQFRWFFIRWEKDGIPAIMSLSCSFEKMYK